MRRENPPMKLRRSRILDSIIAIVCLAAIAIFVRTLIHALYYAPDSELPVPTSVANRAPATHVASTSLPERLIIPAIDVNANVQYVGIAYSGNMMVPNNFTDVGWYKYGPVPGQVGSAVIDGHVDNGLGLAGVFKHLEDIKVGDDVYVETKTGQRLQFVVTDIETYPYKHAPTKLIFGQDDVPRLNLITCEGDWVQGGHTYDHRIVVFTKLAEG